MPTQLKGVLFDFDDTLIDWSGVQLSWRALEAERLASIEAYLKQKIDGLTLDIDQLSDDFWRRTSRAWGEARVSLRAPRLPQLLLASLKAAGVDTAALDETALLQAYSWGAVPGTVVFPDVPPMLEMLRARGIKLGIVTNASQPMVLRDVELRAHGLIEYFPACRFSAADVGYLKPHRRIFEAALECLGCAPAETVFIGDNPIADIAGAQAAGLRAVRRIVPGALARGKLAPPHRSVHSLAELPPILDDWYPGWRNGGQ